jgi:hypothetical protein
VGLEGYSFRFSQGRKIYLKPGEQFELYKFQADPRAQVASVACHKPFCVVIIEQIKPGWKTSHTPESSRAIEIVLE